MMMMVVVVQCFCVLSAYAHYNMHPMHFVIKCFNTLIFSFYSCVSAEVVVPFCFVRLGVLAS